MFDAFAAEQEKIGQALTALTGIPEFAGSYNSAAETTRSIGDSAEGIIAAIPSMVESGVEVLMTPSDWTVEGSLDSIQLALDVAGFVPILGDWLDGVNGVISLARGDKVGAALSFAAMTPVVGSVASAGGKLARFGPKKADDVLAAGKFVKCKVTGTGCFAAGTKVWVSAQANDDDDNENSFSNAFHSVVAVAKPTTITSKG